MKKIFYMEKEKNLIKAELKYIIKYKGIEYYANRCFTCKQEDLNKAVTLFAKSIKNVIFKDAKTFYMYGA